MSSNHTTIGFKAQTGVTVQDTVNKHGQYINVDDVIKQKGYMEALKVLEEYFSCKFPFIKGEERDQKYMGKLLKIKQRYFDPI